MESITVVAGWHNPRLKQMKTSSNAAAMDIETKEEKLLTLGRSQIGRDLQRNILASTAKP